LRLENLEAFDHRADLDLLTHLPVHELLDVRVVHVEADHLGGAARRSAALDRRRGPITDAQPRS
jgi:hypothetical protein